MKSATISAKDCLYEVELWSDRQIDVVKVAGLQRFSFFVCQGVNYT
jgi:hypothetical protein